MEAVVLQLISKKKILISPLLNWNMLMTLGDIWTRKRPSDSCHIVSMEKVQERKRQKKGRKKLKKNRFILFSNFRIKLRMEMGNVSKRQQPDQRADNSWRPPMGLQCSEKFPHPEVFFSWPLNKNVYYLTKSPKYTQETKIKNHTRLTRPESPTCDRCKNAAGLNMFFEIFLFINEIWSYEFFKCSMIEIYSKICYTFAIVKQIILAC